MGSRPWPQHAAASRLKLLTQFFVGALELLHRVVQCPWARVRIPPLPHGLNETGNAQPKHKPSKRYRDAQFGMFPNFI